MQSTLEKKLQLIFNETINLIVSARTDRHVHAIRQYCHFDVKTSRISTNKLVGIVNRLLPDDIRAISFHKVSEKFHARFCAKGKIYVYIVNTDEHFNVFHGNLVYQYGKKINYKKCQNIVKYFIGKHDFLSFTTEIRHPTEREIKDIKIFKKDKLFFFVFIAPSFLRSMVRMIVGSILAYNENKIDRKSFLKLFSFPSKGKAGFSVPGCGLYLVDVIY